MAKMEEKRYVREGHVHAHLEKARAYKDKYTTNIGGHEFIVHPDVFNPEVFSSPPEVFDLWMNFIHKIKPNSLLEIGAGAGYYGILAALNGANRVTSTDVSQQAVTNIQVNVEKYNLTDRMRVLHGSVFEPLSENDRFDLIFWNFPYSHIDKPIEELSTLERTLFDPGYRLVETYIRDAHKYLTNTGHLVLMFSNEVGDLDRLSELAEKHGWRLQLIENPDSKATQKQWNFDGDDDSNFFELIKK
jgi:release factor glutamine methyltransferase